MTTKTAVSYLMRNTEYYPFIKWLIDYDKEEWTILDLKRDYPDYDKNTISSMLLKLKKHNIIRRDKTIRISTPEYPCQPCALWRLNRGILDNIKRIMETYE